MTMRMMLILGVGMASFFLLLSLACAHHTQTQFPDMVKFGYSGSIGPDSWGCLSPNYTTCSQGKHQSPIDIIKRHTIVDQELEPLDRNYTPSISNATLIDNGFNVMLKYGDNIGTVMVEGKNYSLKQMHWHMPSEHTIDGQRFAAELHLVHVSQDGNITVVAILYQYGEPDAFIQKIQDKLGELAEEVRSGDQRAHISCGTIDTETIRRRSRRYYRYLGSLTTPPCSENVIWSILGKVRHISHEQLQTLMRPLEEEYHHNCRPTQPLNGRKVWLLKDNDQ